MTSRSADYNLNLLEEEADAGDAWDYSPAWIPGETVRSSQSKFTARLAECGAIEVAFAPYQAVTVKLK